MEIDIQVKSQYDSIPKARHPLRLILGQSWRAQLSNDRWMRLSSHQKGNGPLLTKVSALSFEEW